LKNTGAACGADAERRPPERDVELRKSYQRLNVAGSSESRGAVGEREPLALRAGEVLGSVGQWPPVCSSVNWQARKTRTLISVTNVIGASGSATFGT
jgi:hypothetical protein